MNDQQQTNPAPDDPRQRRPYRIRLPGFIKEPEVGLGDAIKRAAYLVGARPCDGCRRRAATLNRWVVFTR
jgi:hypothetical protein